MDTISHDDPRGSADHHAEGGGGQVSEVSVMDDAEADTPIQPDQSVAGSPNDESGGVDEGPQGPNANPNAGASAT